MIKNFEYNSRRTPVVPLVLAVARWDSRDFLMWMSFRTSIGLQILPGGTAVYGFFSCLLRPAFSGSLRRLSSYFLFQASVFLAARVVSFILFLGMLGLLTILFGATRGWRWALLPAVLLSFLPDAIR